jgi:hypothetical protein
MRKLIEIAPDETDTMPREVAIAMLSAPKARLTNRMRKNCKLALQHSYTSTQPLIKDGGKYYTLDTANSREARAQQKIQSHTLAQLVRWLRRLVNHRRISQEKYVALTAKEGLTGKPEAARLRAMGVLEHLVAVIDAQRDSIEDELVRRASLCENHPPIDPRIRRHQALLAGVALARKTAHY